MINEQILSSLKEHFKGLQQHISLVVQTGEHDKRSELIEFLTKIEQTSTNIEIKHEDINLRSPVSFQIEANSQATGIVFSGIPSGHEFNSLILAILNVGGTSIKLDEGIQQLVKNVTSPLNFEVFVSLSCHNCPDIVQTLNQFALLNDHISTEMIDGGLFPELIEQRDIQGVPSVYLNGEVFASGKVEATTLLDKLVEKFPEIKQAPSSDSLVLQDVTIIGGGPAGASAAIYSARKGLNVTLIADRIGGQVKDTMGIENFISVPKTTGPELVSSLEAHMADYQITTKQHLRVEKIDAEQKIKTLHLSSGEIIKTKTVIIATGARWRELGVPGEKENIGKGVAYCPHCDGPFFKGKDVAVIGGGNSGVEAALDLSNMVKSVTVFEFMPQLKADQILVDKAESTNNIEIITNVATKKIEAIDQKVSSIQFQDRSNEAIYNKNIDGVFVQIGLVPNSQFLQDTVELNSYGEIEIDDHCKTSVDGIYACGDVTTVPYKQIVISMGEGAKAALSAFEYLLKFSDTEQVD